MNKIDIFILIVLFFGCFMGWRKGAIKQLIFLLGIIFFSYISQFLSPILSPLLVRHLGIRIDDSPWLATGIFFFVFLISATLIASFTTSLLKHTPLSMLNKLAGGAVGGIFSLVCMSYLFIIIDSVHAQIRLPQSPQTEEVSLRSESLYYDRVKHFAPTLFNTYLLNKEKQTNTTDNTNEEPHTND